MKIVDVMWDTKYNNTLEIFNFSRAKSHDPVNITLKKLSYIAYMFHTKYVLIN